MEYTLKDVVAYCDQQYPPETAESWDAVGLVLGDPDAPVRRVLFAVDPVAAVVDEAIAWGADLLVTHHPLLLRPVHSVAHTSAKGAVVHRLIAAGCALYTAHTNADIAQGGVAEALATVLGLQNLRPLIGPSGAMTGPGRLGELPGEVSLGDFAAQVAHLLPRTAQGVRVAGDLAAMVRTVAVVGGSGDSYFSDVCEIAADVYVTSDLRHHPVSELRERLLHQAGSQGRPFLIDVAHFASEWPWLPVASAQMMKYFHSEQAQTGLAAYTFEVKVSTLVTDPWTARIG